MTMMNVLGKQIERNADELKRLGLRYSEISKGEKAWKRGKKTIGVMVDWSTVDYTYMEDGWAYAFCKIADETLQTELGELVVAVCLYDRRKSFSWIPSDDE